MSVVYGVDVLPTDDNTCNLKLHRDSSFDDYKGILRKFKECIEILKANGFIYESVRFSKVKYENPFPCTHKQTIVIFSKDGEIYHVSFSEM